MENILQKTTKTLSGGLPLVLATMGLFSLQLTAIQVFSLYQPSRANIVLFPIIFLGLAAGLGISTKIFNRKLWFSLILLAPILILLFGLLLVGFASSSVIFPSIFLIFTLMGLIQGKVFRDFVLKSGSARGAYFFDLVGAGLGTLFLFVIVNLQLVTSFFVIVWVYFFLFLVTHNFQRTNPKIKVLVTIIGNIFALLVIVASQNIDLLQIMSVEGHPPIPKDGEFQVNARACLQADACKKLHSKWDITAQVDVLEDKRNERVFLYYNNERFTEVNKDGKNGSFKSRLPFPVPALEKVLVIGPGGGTEIAQALGSGATQVSAVEINKSTVDLMKGPLSELSNGVYSLANTTYGDGRNYLEFNSTNEKLDLVLLTYVDLHTSSGASGIFHENYIYTKEGFDSIFRRLSDDGVVLIKRGIPFSNKPRYEVIRILMAISDSLREQNQNPNKNVILLLTSKQGRSFPDHLFILVSRTPIKPEYREQLVNLKISEGRNVHYIELQNESDGGGKIGSYISLLKPKVKAALDNREIKNKEGFLFKTPTDEWPFIYVNQASLIGGADLIWILFLLAATVIAVRNVFNGMTIEDKKNIGAKLMHSSWLGLIFGAQQLLLFHLFGRFIGVPIVSLFSVSAALIIGGALATLLTKNVPQRKMAFSLVFALFYFMIIIVLRNQIFSMMADESRSLVGFFSFILILPFTLIASMPFPLILSSIKKVKDEAVVLGLSLNLFGCAIGVLSSIYFTYYFGFTSLLLLTVLAYSVITVFLYRGKIA